MPGSGIDPRDRFSDRVADYVRYRPGYPQAVVADIVRWAGLEHGAPVADIGAGTGIFSELLLEHGLRVIAVEPNAAMRAASDARLSHHEGYRSVDGSADATGLPDRSVALVCAAQAYHWFHGPATKAEWQRILRPGAAAALIWNVRRVTASPFMQGYEDVIRELGTDYASVHHEGIGTDELDALFGRGAYTKLTYDTEQSFDLDGVIGRLMSASYAPRPGHPNHRAAIERITGLFQGSQKNGSVAFVYETRVFLGRLG